ncbi:histidine phosphatase family protein [Saccharicrinis sp. FJH2]|uniref:SixA phosphatase family protein n=1 Tax=Saccharicrinis sp. FJH65 TaxID=3344659 RepID=UPI0035F25729
MKRLIFVRHAKAETFDGQKNDFERQLASKGQNDAGIMSTVLLKANIRPDLIYSSSADRAFQTAQIFAEKLNINPGKVKKNDDLYEDVTTSDILEIISTTMESVKSLMIVGHNPWISDVTGTMSDSYDDIMPTCGMVVLDFKVDYWDEVLPGNGSVKLDDFPKNYR